jgi:hypothetical protein
MTPRRRILFGRFVEKIDQQALAAFNSLIAAGFTCPQGLIGINAAFKTIKNIYGTSDITTAISFFGDPSLSYQIGTGSGTTLEQAIRTLPNLVDSTRATDAVQTTAASQPLLLLHEGANYWFAPNVSGNYIESNVSYAISDFDVEFSINANYSAATGRVCGSRKAGEGTNVLVNATQINLEYRVAGTTYFARANVTNTNFVEYTFRVTRNSTTGAVVFTRNGATLTTFDSQVAGTLENSNTTFQVNGVLNGVQGLQGRINWVKCYNAGVLVQHFNPNQYNPATSQTQWTSSTGEIWTISTGTATTGYKGVLVDRNMMQGDGVDDRLTTGTLPTKQYFTRFAGIRRHTDIGNNYGIAGNPIENHLVYGSIPAFYNPPSQILASPATLVNRLFLLTGDYNGATSKLRTNANADVSGSTGAATSNIINLFSSGSGTFFANWTITTLIDTVAVSNDAQKTAMYNYIRSINNNAF